MANYYETYRTNYFGVKNNKKFLEVLKDADIPHDMCDSVRIKETGNIFVNEKGNVLIPPRKLFFVGDIGGDAPGIYDDNTDYFMSFSEIVEKHLLPSEVCIYIYVGNEKLRYIEGGVYTIYPEVEGVSLSDNIDRFGEVRLSLDTEILHGLEKMNIPPHNKRVTY